MSSIVMMVGGAIVNALAFLGSNFIFSTMRESNAKEIEEEWKRHYKALEQLKTAQLCKQNHSIQTFKDVESAMHKYILVYRKTLDPIDKKPTLSQYNTPSEAHKDSDIACIVLGLTSVA